jgi:hypothetical protein
MSEEKKQEFANPRLVEIFDIEPQLGSIITSNRVQKVLNYHLVHDFINGFKLFSPYPTECASLIGEFKPREVLPGEALEVFEYKDPIYVKEFTICVDSVKFRTEYYTLVGRSIHEEHTIEDIYKTYGATNTNFVDIPVWDTINNIYTIVYKFNMMLANGLGVKIINTDATASHNVRNIQYRVFIYPCFPQHEIVAPPKP